MIPRDAVVSNPAPVTTAPVRISADHPEWQRLKTAATALRGLQIQDGSVPELAHHGAAASHVLAIVEAVEALAPCFPHDARYLELVCVDFTRWMEAGFGVPDFLDSLLAFEIWNEPNLARFWPSGPRSTAKTGSSTSSFFPCTRRTAARAGWLKLC